MPGSTPTRYLVTKYALTQGVKAFPASMCTEAGDSLQIVQDIYADWPRSLYLHKGEWATSADGAIANIDLIAKAGCD
jgi:hypothetical protein